jgi:hypothetical protein
VGKNLKQIIMNQTTATAAAPATIEQVKLLRHFYSKSHAQAHAHIYTEGLLPTAGPLTGKQIFKEDGKLVYEFYRVRNKEQKVYVIF